MHLKDVVAHLDEMLEKSCVYCHHCFPKLDYHCLKRRTCQSKSYVDEFDRKSIHFPENITLKERGLYQL